MNKARKKIIESNEISEVYTFKLGGYNQKVLIEGTKKELPIVIILHGGPGTPIPFSVGCRGLFPEFTNKFIMVYWDQLGCGINNYKIDDNFTINSFVNMTIDLLNEVRKLFKNNKIYIFATSWGSVLSAKVAELKPEEINGVIVSGQIIKNIFFNEYVLNTLENSKIPKKKLNIIKNTNAKNATSKELQLISSSLTKYTDAYYNKKGEKAPIMPLIKGLITSPDYKMKDVKALIFNGYRGNNSIWNELLKIDLTATLKNIKVPYIIFQGDTDVVAPTKMVQDLVESSNNDILKCYVIKNTGHLSSAKMAEEILNKLIELNKV